MRRGLWAVCWVILRVVGYGLGWVVGRRSSGWVMGYGLWVMCYGLWVVGYGLWVMGGGWWVMGYGSWLMGYARWVMGDE